MKTFGSALFFALFSIFVLASPVNAQSLSIDYGNTRDHAAIPHGAMETAKPAAPVSERSVLYIDRFVSMAAGAALAALASEVLLDTGGAYAVVLGTMGLVVGDWWYKEGMWPFNQEGGLFQDTRPATAPEPEAPRKGPDLLSQRAPEGFRIW